MRKERESIIVIADTHLGLKISTWNFLGLRNTLSCEPKILSGFLNWLKELEEKGSTKIRLSDTEEKLLVPPSELILLGDILELWDASNRSIEYCSKDFNDVISDLKCEKIYLLGNHDDILEEVSGHFPSGSSTIKIISGTYPEQSERTSFKVVGEKKYLFLHGHQFDSMFKYSGPLWKLLSYLRDGAEAFGSFSWILVGLFVVCMLLCLFPQFQINKLFLLLLGALTIPRLGVSIFRPIWTQASGKRYDRKGSVKGFYKFWKNYTKDVDDSADVNIVHGHTHLIDLISPEEIENIVGKTDWKVRATLINIPSWVWDEKDIYQDLLFAVFLYIDDQHAYFFGWDWHLEQPFYISNKMIPRARVEYPLPIMS